MYTCKICDDVKPKNKKKTIDSIIEQDLKELEQREKYSESVHPRGSKDDRIKASGNGSASYDYKPNPKWAVAVTYDPYKSQVTYAVKTNNKNTGLRLDAFNVLIEALNLLVKKHEDYGPKNISEAPGGALQGLLVRLHDKMARLKNLTDNNKTPNNESIEDTFIDIINYATIALLVLQGKWDS